MRDAVGGWRTLFTKSSVCVGPNAKRQKGPPSTDGPPDGSKSRFYGILFWQWLPFPPAVFAETRRPRSSYRFAYGRRASAAAAIGKRSYHGHWGPDHTSTGQNSRDTPPLYLVPLATSSETHPASRRVQRRPASRIFRRRARRVTGLRRGPPALGLAGPSGRPAGPPGRCGNTSLDAALEVVFDCIRGPGVPGGLAAPR